MSYISIKFKKPPKATAKFKVGDKVYSVYSTTENPIIKEYVVKQIFYNIDALLLIDEKGVEKKIYKDMIETLLTKEESLNKIAQLKPVKFANSSEIEFRCFNCGAVIFASNYNKCSKCGGYKCKNCKSCFCHKKMI